MQFEVNVSQNLGYMRVVGSDLSLTSSSYCLQQLARDIGQMMTKFRRVARAQRQCATLIPCGPSRPFQRNETGLRAQKQESGHSQCLGVDPYTPEIHTP